MGKVPNTLSVHAQLTTEQKVAIAKRERDWRWRERVRERARKKSRREKGESRMSERLRSSEV